MSNKQTLDEIVNMVYREIPKGYSISIEMENGYMGVILWHDDEECEIDYGEGSLYEQIKTALSWAKKEDEAIFKSYRDLRDLRL